MNSRLSVSRIDSESNENLQTKATSLSWGGITDWTKEEINSRAGDGSQQDHS